MFKIGDLVIVVRDISVTRYYRGAVGTVSKVSRMLILVDFPFQMGVVFAPADLALHTPPAQHYAQQPPPPGPVTSPALFKIGDHIVVSYPGSMYHGLDGIVSGFNHSTTHIYYYHIKFPDGSSSDFYEKNLRAMAAPVGAIQSPKIPVPKFKTADKVLISDTSFFMSVTEGCIINTSEYLESIGCWEYKVAVVAIPGLNVWYLLERHLTLKASNSKIRMFECECGAVKCGYTSHSAWCPLAAPADGVK